MKELIIMVFKIDVEGLSRQQAEQQILQLMKEYDFNEDDDIKDDYIIKQIWLPTHGITDVKVIYPIPNVVKSAELEELVQEITQNINKNPDGILAKNWDRLLRELKLSKLNKLSDEKYN